MLAVAALGRRAVVGRGASSLLSRGGLLGRALSGGAGAGEEELQRTALYDLHLELGGSMVPFAGYELPVQYASGGVKKEVLHTRDEGKASLFDVGHMGQLEWRGADRVRFLESLVVGDVAALEDGAGMLSLITNENGGIIDDTVITNAGDFVYMVVNGATKHGDIAHFRAHMDAFDGEVELTHLETQNLVALQGPGAAAVVQRLLPTSMDGALARMSFMTGFVTELSGIPVRLTRCGYTGEDGFEISVSEAEATRLTQMLVDQDEVAPAGLGARDALRLEAGLCLYGHDIDDATNPVEATLTWTMGGAKSRRRTEQGFLGADKFLTPEGKLRAVARKRVGIMGMRAPAREGAPILSKDGSREIGTITSGTFSPCLKKPIAMGYIEKEHAKAGSAIAVKVRGKVHQAEVTKMPFVPNRYFKPE